MKMKNLVCLGMAMVLSLGLVACGNGGGEESSEAADKLDAVKESGKLVVAMSADYPPFEFHSTKDGADKIAGVDADLANAVAKEIGVDVEFKEMTFDGLVGALKADKVDMVISGMSPSPERKKNVDFSDVYYTGKNVLIVREGEEDKITSEDQVKSMKVAAQKGSIQETYANKIGCTGLKSLESVPDLMMELKNGNVDAVIVNDTVGLINVNQIDGIALSNFNLPEGDAEESMAIAVKKGNNTAYLEAINKAVKDFVANDLQKSLEDNSALAAQE